MQLIELQVGEELFLGPDICLVIQDIDGDGVALRIAEPAEVCLACLPWHGPAGERPDEDSPWQ